MPIWLQAGLWGLLGASSLVIGAGVAYLVRLPQRVTAGIMAFGCGVLISAVAYDLLEDGFQEGGIAPIVIGAVIGSAAYTVADWLVSRAGAQRRKRSEGQQQELPAAGGSPLQSVRSWTASLNPSSWELAFLGARASAWRCSPLSFCRIFPKACRALSE